MTQSSLESAAVVTEANHDMLIERVRNKLALVIPDPRNIDIKAKGGIVTLSGQLRDAAQRRAASWITHQVDGVTNVVNKLMLGNEWAIHGALLRGPVVRKPRARTARRNGSAMSLPPVDSAGQE